MSDFVILFLQIFFVFSYFVFYFYYAKKLVNLGKQVDDLEKQIAHISKAFAEFFCTTNNRIADISTAFDCCDTNIDTLFDEKDKINESLTDLKRSVDFLDCKLSGSKIIRIL